MSSGEKLRELGRVLRAWVAGEGPIGEVMLAWLEEKGLLQRHFQDGRPTIYDFGGFAHAVLKTALAGGLCGQNA